MDTLVPSQTFLIILIQRILGQIWCSSAWAAISRKERIVLPFSLHDSEIHIRHDGHPSRELQLLPDPDPRVQD